MPMDPPTSKRRPSRSLGVTEAVLPVVAMLGLFLAGAILMEPTGELLVAVLLGSAAVAGGVGVRHGVGWEEIQRSTGEKLAAVLPAILILLAIGMLIASWVLSGTIPYLVYWGVQLVSPRMLVLTAFLATAVMSLFTGTSWGSAGTLGVALMGTAAALDAPLAATAGAVVSGAYFGDKMSPLSDTTNVAAIGAGSELYAHIRHMLYTALPSFVVALLVYGGTAAALPVAGEGIPPGARELLIELEEVFSLSPWTLVPAVIVVWSILRRTPAALAISLSSVVAFVLAMLLQGFGPGQVITAAVAGVDVGMVAASGADPAGVGPAFRALVERGGLYSMATTLVVIIAAFLLAGAMDASGALDLLVRKLLASVDSVFGLVGATMASGVVTVALTSHAGVTALVVGGLFQGAYDERGMARVNLSRSLEDSVTLTEPLMPWTVSGVFMATTLGVPTLSYAPWALFCLTGPVFSLLLAALWRRTGFGLKEGIGGELPGAGDSDLRPGVGSPSP